jgi:hypothetical protein
MALEATHNVIMRRLPTVTLEIVAILFRLLARHAVSQRGNSGNETALASPKAICYTSENGSPGNPPKKEPAS